MLSISPSFLNAAEISVKPPIIDVVVENVYCYQGPYKPKLPNTIKEYKALGPRIKEQIQPAADYTGDPKTHTSGRFWYQGMELGVVFVNTKPYGYFLEGAVISDKRWNNISPIKIGSSILDLFKKEGIATIPPRNSIISMCSSETGAPDCINISLKELIISKVEYECYTG